MRLFGRKPSPPAAAQNAVPAAGVVTPGTGTGLDSEAAVVADSVAVDDGAEAAAVLPADPVPEIPAAATAAVAAPPAPAPSPNTAARLAFLEKGTAMNSSSPKPPAASFLSGAPRSDVSPRRMLDGPAGGASAGVGGGLASPLGMGRPATPAPAAPGVQSVSEPLVAAPVAEPQRRLTVGRDISLCGEIASCEVLVVEGTVEAKLREGRSIEVTETGLFKGSVEIDEADIGGTFEGDIIVRNRLRVRSTGRITGSVVYGELEVENGGQLNGTIKLYDPKAKTTVGSTDGVPSEV